MLAEDSIGALRAALLIAISQDAAAQGVKGFPKRPMKFAVHGVLVPHMHTKVRVAIIIP